MLPKLAIYPEYWVKIMDGYAKGKRYMGETSIGFSRPDGMGIIERKKNTYYVGEFENGQAYGRGFMLTYKKWQEKHKETVQGTYEEVMETAVFDDCGRVIHCDPVYHTVEFTEDKERWQIIDDGIWEMDSFHQPVSMQIFQSEWWKDAQMGYIVLDVYRHSGSLSPRYTTKPLSARTDEGLISLEEGELITVYDNLSLLVLPHSGAPFRLEVGQEHIIYRASTSESGRELIYTFSLGKDYKKYIDLQLQEWYNGNAVKPSMAAEFLYTRAINSLVFLCNDHYRPETKEYAMTILKRIPQTRLKEERVDGTYVVEMPDDEWTISAQLDHTWIYSAKAKNRIRITGRDVEGIAEIAERAADIWAYIKSKLG